MSKHINVLFEALPDGAEPIYDRLTQNRTFDGKEWVEMIQYGYEPSVSALSIQRKVDPGDLESFLLSAFESCQFACNFVVHYSRDMMVGVRTSDSDHVGFNKDARTLSGHETWVASRAREHLLIMDVMNS